MTKTLFIECRDESGKNVTEIWAPSDEEMAELGWIRADEASKIATAIANHGTDQVVAMAQGMAGALSPRVTAHIGSYDSLERYGMGGPNETKCSQVERGARCQLLDGHPGPHEFRMLDANPVNTVGIDDDPEPTRYDVPDLETKANGHHVAEAELGDCACHSPNVDQSPGGAYFCRGCGLGVGYLNRPAPEAEKLLLSERVAELLRERKCFTFEAGHHPVTQAVLDVLDAKFGRTF